MNSELLRRLRRVSEEMIEAASVSPGASIRGKTNTTGLWLIMPDGKAAYPGFWPRDAAMTLGADLVSADRVEDWIRICALTQAGPQGIRLANGLHAPPFSIPDHITMNAEACWFPGAYEGEDQGSGTYGFITPADNGFFFIQLVAEHARLTGSASLMDTHMKTPWGEAPLLDIALNAFDSVDVDEDVVICSGDEGKTRADWGFCDSINKTGLCLMPTLLRWRAARDLVSLFTQRGDPQRARRFDSIAASIQRRIVPVFFEGRSDGTGILLSATGIGRQEDVWAEAYAVWLGLLPEEIEARICRRLAALAVDPGVVFKGQVRHLPAGEFWQKTPLPKGVFQNGPYWSTPSGWFIYAVSRVDPALAEQVLKDLVDFVDNNRAEGAPWEWVNPEAGAYDNALYCASVTLPYTALVAR